MKKQDINKKLPAERTFGIHWVIEEDMIGFPVSLKDKLITTIEVLYTLTTTYSPLKYFESFLLEQIKIVQRLCFQFLGWGDPLIESFNMNKSVVEEYLPH